MEIQSILEEHHYNLPFIYGIFGFGSFFKGKINYSDIDLLLVTFKYSPEIKELKGILKKSFLKNNLIIVLLVLNLNEFKEDLLLEGSELELIYLNEVGWIL
ncbi:hypothetical protein [Neisseria animaloris]|uniref:hypothetical protein n=1 Tax=Neisseria animaloris TaxID=326522 RepID=UPI00117C2B76|nr:hypothetical protein [Neisseria animaloris]